MRIEGSRSQIDDVSGSMTSVREQLLDSFRTSKEYRHAFLEEAIRSGLAAQIKAIRERQNMTQTSFAHALKKSQSWVSRLEDPNESIPTVPTLLLIAETFDVGLEVRFVPFSGVLDRLSAQTPESFEIPGFEHDPGLVNTVTAEEAWLTRSAAWGNWVPSGLTEQQSGEQRGKKEPSLARLWLAAEATPGGAGRNASIVPLQQIAAEVQRRKGLAGEEAVMQMAV